MANLTWNIAMKIITIIKLHIKVVCIQRNEKICVFCFVLLWNTTQMSNNLFLLLYKTEREWEWAMKS